MEKMVCLCGLRAFAVSVFVFPVASVKSVPKLWGFYRLFLVPEGPSRFFIAGPFSLGGAMKKIGSL